MDTFKALLTRRSIRKYAIGDIPQDSIKRIIEAGMHAPSAGNQQPWHFIAINNKGILSTVPQYHPHAQMMREAAAAVLVCADLTLEKHKGYWVQDCSAAVENMLLAAHDLGLGAVWLGVYPREDRVKALSKLFGLPDSVIPFAIIPIGYPAEQKKREHRFNTERIHYEKW